MLYEKTQKQQDSDASESEDEDYVEGEDSQNEENDEGPQNKKEVEMEIWALKKELLEYLNDDKNENANQAIARLRT